MTHDKLTENETPQNIDGGDEQQPQHEQVPVVPKSETLPLKSSEVGYLPKSRGCFSCSEELDGLNIIIGFFTVFTIAVTIALIVQIHYGAFEVQVVPHGSVTSDSQVCSLVGVNLLKRGGNAVDAAVATSLCMGVVYPHMTGLGGGGFLLLYDHKRRRVVDVIDFRETAPSTLPSTLSPSDNSHLVGVPGFLKGLYNTHAEHGLLPWRQVIEPSIQLAREGVTVSKSLLDSKEQIDNSTSKDPGFSELLDQIQPDGVILQTRLADTLEVIADHGPDSVYNGSLSLALLSTVANQSLMSLDDLAAYRAISRRPLVGNVGDYTLLVPGAPSGGPLLLSALSVLGSPIENPHWWGPYSDAGTHAKYFAETLRLAALYHAQLGDPDQSEEAVFNATLQMTDPQEIPTLRKEIEAGGGSTWSNWLVPSSAGTFVGVIDNQELYVAAVTGLNSIFGSQLMSPLGFLLNDALIDFTPEGPSNTGSPGRRPLSVSVPAILLQTGAPCGQRLVLGGSDAGRVAQTIANIIYSHRDIQTAVEQPRISLDTKNITSEVWHTPLMEESVMQELEGFGYRILPIRPPYVSVNVLQKYADELSVYADSRGGGSAISY